MSSSIRTTKYLHLVAWCRHMGSHGYYIEMQIQHAEEDKAPEDVIFCKTDYDTDKRTWTRWQDITNLPVKQLIAEAVEQMRQARR